MKLQPKPIVPDRDNPHDLGVLLVNLGTPASPDPRDVKRYLIEFLTDPRVIDLPFLQRELLVRLLIVPRRYRESARLYREIWTEEGSPLLVNGKKLTEALQIRLGNQAKVVLAMRYQSPSIPEGLEKLRHCREILILPLFPQYASATTGSVHAKVMETVKNWITIPSLTFVNSYHDHPRLIEAFAAKMAPALEKKTDKVLFSFHGLPEKQIRKADPSGNCLQSGCCEQKSCRMCYKQQCSETAHAIAQKLSLPPHLYEICFQSRLGKDPWIQPYMTDRIEALSAQGLKQLVVACPAFVCDCLETTYEIGNEYAHAFKRGGGDSLQLVEGLNDHPLWVETLYELIYLRGGVFRGKTSLPSDHSINSSSSTSLSSNGIANVLDGST